MLFAIFVWISLIISSPGELVGEVLSVRNQQGGVGRCEQEQVPGEEVHDDDDVDDHGEEDHDDDDHVDDSYDDHDEDED